MLSSLPHDVLVHIIDSIDMEKYPLWFFNRTAGGPELDEPDDYCLQVAFRARWLLARALRATCVYMRFAVLQWERLLTFASTKRCGCSANLASMFQRLDNVRQVDLYACARAYRSFCMLGPNVERLALSSASCTCEEQVSPAEGAVVCALSGSIAAIMNSKARLTAINFKTNDIDPVCVRAIVTRYPLLLRLSMACMKITDADVTHIAMACPSLTHIDLTFTAVGDAGVAALATCSRLQHVGLSLCRNVGDVGVDALATGCKLLTYLMLYGTRVGNVGMGVVSMHSVELTHVACAPGHTLLSARWPKLRFLHISGHEISVCHLAEAFPLLEHFYLTSTNLNDEALHTLFAFACVNLKGVEIVSCQNVSDAGILALAKCSNLIFVYLHQTCVSEEGTRALQVALPGLLYMNGELHAS